MQHFFLSDVIAHVAFLTMRFINMRDYNDIDV